MLPIIESSFVTTRTTRLYRLGEISAKTKSIWLLFHGYGQSAKYFLQKFESIQTDETALIAPEGLSKFYIKGFDGRVGASWMTKEDRENEIKDQLSYVNLLISEMLPENTELNLLGFSQGAAVACRWYQQTSIKVKNLVIWGAGLPIETTAGMAQKYGDTNTIFMLGDQDEFIQPDVLKDHFSRLDLLHFEHKRVMYKGRHEVEKEALHTLTNYLI